MNINEIKKPAGSCRNVIAMISGNSINIGDSRAKLVCDCKDEYSENALVIEYSENDL